MFVVAGQESLDVSCGEVEVLAGLGEGHIALSDCQDEGTVP